MAEADNWSRLSEQKLNGEARSKSGFVFLASVVYAFGKMSTNSNRRAAAADLN
jgi:hypothetical protein